MKSKKLLKRILSLVLIGALAGSVTVGSTFTVSAVYESFPIDYASYGVVGDFNNWSNDIIMNDNDGDGIYTAVISVPQNGSSYKIRANGNCDYIWGASDSNGFTANGDSCVFDESKYGQDITVYFDTRSGVDGIDKWYVGTVKPYPTATPEEDFVFEWDPLHECTELTGYRGKETKVVIPPTIEYIGWGRWSSGFANIGSVIESLTIPYTVSYIDPHTFTTVNVYKEFIVHENNQRYSSEDGVLFNKKKTGLLVYPKEKAVDYYRVPDGVTYIGDYAFSECENLTNVVLPDSIKTIGYGAFLSCRFTNITIPNNVESIQMNAFDGCENLTSITIPSSVEMIDYSAFCGCDSLTSVSIQNGVTYIDDFAFSDCENLMSVYIPSSVTKIGNNAFGKIYDKETKEYVTIPGFVICGEEGTAAEEYANENNITFKPFKKSLKNYSKINANIINKGDTITLNAQAEGGKAPYKYKYYYRTAEDSDFVALTDLTTETTCKHTPTKALKYSYLVEITDATENTNVKRFDIIVNDATLANNSEISALEISKGDTITLKAKATGGTAPYKYKYYCKTATASGYMALTDSTTETTCEHTPTRALMYNYAVKIADAKGKTQTKYFTITVNYVPLANNSEISALEISKGDTITLKAKATGGTAPYKYKYYCKTATASGYMALTDSTTKTTCEHTPTRALVYNYAVKIADAKGKTQTKYFTVTVK